MDSVALCDISGGTNNLHGPNSASDAFFSQINDVSDVNKLQEVPKEADLLMIHCSDCIYNTVRRLTSFRVVVRLSSAGSAGYPQEPRPVIHNYDGSVKLHSVNLPSSVDNWSDVASRLAREPHPIIHDDDSIELHLVKPPSGIDNWSDIASTLTDFDEVKRLAQDPESHELGDLFLTDSTPVSLSALSVLCQGFLVAHAASSSDTSLEQNHGGVLSSIGWDEVDDETRQELDPAPEAAENAEWWMTPFQGSDDFASQIKMEWEQNLSDREWADGKVFSLLECISTPDPEPPTVEKVADAYMEIRDCLE
jgi:hypothetical protein